MQAQPYYRPDCNAGAAASAGQGAAAKSATPQGEAPTAAPDLVTAAQRLAYARCLGPEAFSALLARIEAASEQVGWPACMHASYLACWLSYMKC